MTGPKSWQVRLARNGFLLVLPVLLWNAVLWPRLPETAGGTGSVPPWLEALETALRAGVFLAPLFLRVAKDEATRRIGGRLYSAGLLLYFLTWIPWLQGRELEHVVYLLGPYCTPMLVLGGIALLCSSRAYFVVSVAFVVVHAWAGVVQGGVS